MIDNKDKSPYLLLVILLAVAAIVFIQLKTLLVRSDIRQLWTPGIFLSDKAPQHITKPDIVRGLYLTASSAGNEAYRKNIIKQMTNSRINSVVIDIKDYSGYILYNSSLDILKKFGAVKPVLADVKKILDEFHLAGTYVIARQTVFQDPLLAQARPDLAFHDQSGNVWLDYKGLTWLDPGQKEVWDYNLAIAQEAVALGFDEINFDYIRYPSDGNIAALDYNLPADQKMTDVMKSFFAFLDKNLKNVATTSIDMFGLVMDNTRSAYDLGIGQKLTDAADYFDYVSPMMYPSHYPLTYLGYANSAEHPGAIIDYGLKISRVAMQDKRARIRPWLQAFSLGAVYDKNMIEQQITAVDNVTSTDGWLLWNARNYYPDYIFKK